MKDGQTADSTGKMKEWRKEGRKERRKTRRKYISVIILHRNYSRKNYNIPSETLRADQLTETCQMMHFTVGFSVQCAASF